MQKCKKKDKKFDAEADTGYFVGKGTLDLSKFWSNVQQNYSVKRNTTA